MENNLEEFDLLIYSLIPIILIWMTLMGFTFCFTETISYTLGFWIYGIISIFLGLAITSFIIEKNNNL